MDENLKVVRYKPLVFGCVMCDEQFAADGKSLVQVAQEVADHVSQKHPGLSHTELQKKNAAA